MALKGVKIERWLNLHPGSRIQGRVATTIRGQIGRDEDGDLACGEHYRKLRSSQSGNWTCPITGCKTRIETELPG